jgi:hypothetical protein
MIIYLIGSLRNPLIPDIGNALRKAGHDVYDDWFAGGREADDEWQRYEGVRGREYLIALRGWHAKQVFENDLTHLERCQAGLLVLPAGKSAHLELGWLLGQGKPGYILLDDRKPQLTPPWNWLLGLYEGEGTITRNGKKNGHGMQLSITMTDEDVIRKAHMVAGVGSVEGPYFYANRATPGPTMRKPQWRWVVRKKAEVVYVIKGFWDGLGTRRKTQAMKVLDNAAALSDFTSSKTPAEARMDVMYRFATGVYTSLEDVIRELGSVPSPMPVRVREDGYVGAGKFYCVEPDCSGHHEYPQ